MYADEKYQLSIRFLHQNISYVATQYIIYNGCIFLTSLFLWGFITVLVDSLVPRIKDVFEMNYGRTILVQSAFLSHFCGLVACWCITHQNRV